MNGLDAILEACVAAERRGETAILATVVEVSGSAYRRPGARMLFAASGPTVGIVSGGCLESDLADRAAEVSASGRARTLVYDMRSPDDIVWGLGLGCNGEIRVLLERIGPGERPAYLDFLAGCRRTRRRGVVATVFESSDDRVAVGARLTLDADGDPGGSFGDLEPPRAVLDACRELLGGERPKVRRFPGSPGEIAVLLEPVAAAPRLLVFGAGADAAPLVDLAHQVGWRVDVIDPRPAYAQPSRFPRADAVSCVRFESLDAATLKIDASTAVVLMTHHFLNDLVLLERILPENPPYLGLIGPRQRTENLIEELAQRGLRPTASQRERLYGPIGLDIGSETPEEIALAVVAEIQAVLHRRAGGFLRDRPGPLHEPAP